MDANQTKLHLLLGESDWLRCREGDDYESGRALTSPDANAYWDANRNLVTLQPKPFVFTASKGDRLPKLGIPSDYATSDRRGAARDRFGNWYYISPDRAGILVYSVGSRQTTDFWRCTSQPVPQTIDSRTFVPQTPPPIAKAPAALSGLAVTTDHYLVVGTLDPSGLLIFDLYAGGPPRRYCWPETVPFAPFDMAPRAEGGVWILDRSNRRFWALDRHFRVMTEGQSETLLTHDEPDQFQAEGGGCSHGTPVRSFPEGIALESGSPINAHDPVSIETLPGDSVLILDVGLRDGQTAILRYHFGQRLSDPILAQVLAGLQLPADSPGFPAGYDLAFLPQADNKDPNFLGLLFLVAAEGNQSFSFEVRENGEHLILDARRDYLPMRLFSGMGLITAGTQVYYDSNKRWVPLVSQDRPKFEESAVVITPVFDGREPGCVWHRLMLDGCLPSETDLEIWSRVSADEDQVDLAEWRLEGTLRRRGNGSELPFTTQPIARDSGTFELLFQHARGRYLRLKLVLSGNGRSTPRLRSLRVYYPRFSYLSRYLPALYRADEISASFLDRFLANLEGTNTCIEDKIASAQILFDPRAAPADALNWLAGWFGIVLDPSWDDQRQRLLIRHAMDFFQWRGTTHGLQMALHLAFDETVCDAIFASPDAQCGCQTQSTTSAKSKQCRCSGPDPFRIIEKFRLRPRIRIDLGANDTAASQQPSGTGNQATPNPQAQALFRRYRLWASSKRANGAGFARQELGFEPSDVTEDLKGWQDFLRQRHTTLAQVPWADPNWKDFSEVPLPTDQPMDEKAFEDWSDYVIGSLSTPYGVKRTLWQDFLQRRYGSAQALQAAWSVRWTSFDLVSYPVSLPTQEAMLRDWFQFESLVWPTVANAHRFSVLLPFSGYDLPEIERRIESLQRATRLIELEKPAHTAFDVKFYWALFRLGDARLGIDTTLGLGGRDPALLPQAVLGQTYLGETQLIAGFPFDVTERQIVGRDRLN